MLSNAYFLAKFRFDTAENEPAKKLQKMAIVAILFWQNFARGRPDCSCIGQVFRLRGGYGRPAASSADPASAKAAANFRGLVLGWLAGWLVNHVGPCFILFHNLFHVLDTADRQSEECGHGRLHGSEPVP